MSRRKRYSSSASGWLTPGAKAKHPFREPSFGFSFEADWRGYAEGTLTD